MTAKRKTHPSSKSVDWDELEDALATTKRGPVRDRVSAALDELFDEEERRDLTRLADHARRVRSRNPLIGNIVFLHGITGADLAVVDAAGDSDEIWVNIPRLILGRIQRLQLDAAARREADPKFTVQVAGINKKYYAHGVLALRARWNVETYAYDWRKDIDEASDGLATLIRQKFPGKPVHLVAHSMGGLVSRNLIRRHPQLWDAMKAPDLVAGGRLIMLGTPNYGSFAIPPVLTGGDQMMELLERIDLAHNMPELLAITNTFLGSYMLLPAPSKLSSMLQTLYQRDTWGNAPGISQAHLDRTYQFYHDLDASQTIDPDRMVYVAGSRRATFTEMTIVAPGEFEYKLSYDGDGRVPHALGLLPGVVTYYVDEVHGDLARNEQVLHAVDELLETGRTQELGTTVLRHLDRAAPTMRDYRTAADRRLMEELEQIARKAKAGGGPETLTAEERRIGAGAIVKAALGTSSRSLPKALLTASEGASARKRVPAIERIDLEVGVRFTDITKVKAPVVVVGHYRGVQPVNAIGAIDAALGGWISRALKQGMISGSLGETFFVPTFGAIAARGAVVAGMGDYGRFGPSDLRLLLANVAIGAGAMKLPSIASVLVGGGQGSMDRDTALREFLEGIGTGLQQLLEEGVVNAATLKRLEFVERHPGRFFDLVQKIDALAQAGSLSTVRIKARKPDPADVRRARAEDQRERHKSTSRAALSAVVGAFEEVRVTVESGPTDGAYRFSALTRSAVVPVRDLTIHQHYAVGAANALREARTRDEQEKFGRLL